QAPDRGGGQEGLLLLALLLAAVIGLPLLPGIFNRVVGYISLPFQENDSALRPRLRLATLVEGLLLTSAGWLLLGASLWAVVYAVLKEAPPLTWAAWGRYTA